MILYYSPGACSQAPHIVLHEIGLHHDSRRVNLKSKTLDDGTSYLGINPKGSVPALELENGEILTENQAVLQYLGDRAGSSTLLPGLGDFRRYRVLEAMNFVSTELHKSFGALFNPQLGEDVKAVFVGMIQKKLDYLDGTFRDGAYLTGEEFTIADAYLFVMTSWMKAFQLEVSSWPRIAEFRAAALQRPSVRQVLEFEGLLETA